MLTATQLGAPSVVLTPAELEDLTGYKQPAKQCAWLSSRAWPFEPPSRRGERPKVDRTYYHARMSGEKAAPRRIGPKLDFMLAPQ